ncbi:hypothetical protein AQUCO_09300041v1 [Aquilegia coerulea]|uniref:Uncharacterized protein n=1 Tax=Aquilegia coerulea TaxID=218851 RepID=A0A2G5C5B3_AQUCA|nr:hypothetical protein AQUCO_09300041v1 [Aquilegia coerulea]
MTNSSNSTFEVRGLDKMGDYADIKSSPKQEDEVKSAPPMRVLALEFSSGASCSKPIKDSLASSSRSGLKQQFIEMGFLPNHVDRVFEDHSEENFELLLEGLIAYSDVENSISESSDSLDEIFGAWKDEGNSAAFGANSEFEVTSF